MKKLFALAVFAVAYAGMLYFSIPEKIEIALGDNNKITYSPDIFPITDSLYDLGTTTKAWRTLTVDQVCLTGDSCETTWPTGGFATTGTTTLATTTTSVLNGVVVVDGVHYAQTGAGIQAALNYGCTQGVGGHVHLTTGTYLVTQSIYLPSNCILSGEASSTKLIMSTGAYVGIVGQKNVVVRDIGTDGSSQVSGDFQILVSNASNVVLENNWIENSGGFGIFVIATGTATTTGVFINKNYVEGLGNNDVIGGGPDNAPYNAVKEVSVTDNYCYQHSEYGAGYDYCIDIVGVNRTIFTGNRVHGAVAFGSEQYPNQFSIISNNILETATTSSNRALLSVMSTPGVSDIPIDSVIVTGNILNGNYLQVVGSTNARGYRFNVSNNVVYTTQGSNQAIWIRFMSLGTVSGNVTRYGGRGIYVDASDHVNVTNNNGMDHGAFGYSERTSGYNMVSGNVWLEVSVPRPIDYLYIATSTVVGQNYGNFDTPHYLSNINLFQGRVSIGSSSPMALFTLQANPLTFDDIDQYGTTTTGRGLIHPILLEIASSTQNGATTSLFRILNNGNIGIASTSPSYKLSVDGDAFIGGGTEASGLTVNGGATTTSYRLVSGNTVVGDTKTVSSTYSIRSLNGNGIQFLGGYANTGLALIRDTGQFNIGTTSALSKLNVAGNASIGANYAYNAPTNGLIVEGNVGIGTTSPYSKLSVAGQVVAQNYVATSTTASSTFQAITATAFGIVGKFFADATQFIVSVLATFTQGIIAQVRLNIPNGAQVYTNNTGDCALDTTSGQLRCNNGSATTTIGNGFFSQGFTFASSTLDYMGDYGASGTTTIKRAGLEWAYTFNTLYCKSDNTSTTTLIMGNGTASSTVICSPTGNTGTTDITFTARQDAVFQFGNTVGTPNNVLLDVTWSWTND